jgi:pimeloyl-ACP methyl ester carboxylesterase
MRRRTLIAALAAGCTTPIGAVRQEGFARALGTNIAFARRNGRSPTIVFESGLGDGLEVWAGVIGELDRDVAYFTYSRPGYGNSEGVNEPGPSRSSEQSSVMLHALFHAARVRPPYLLVGHSLGGLYIAHYAARYPNEVVGLVFVDGRPPLFRASCDLNGVRFCSTAGSAPPPSGWPAHIVAELAGMRASEDAAPDAASLVGIPATVITSTNVWPGEQGDEGFALWLENQEAFAQSFASHRFVRAEGAGHYVQREQPALVAREIEALVARAEPRK